MNSEETKLVEKTAADRRAFLKGVGFTGLGLAAATMVGGRLATGSAKVEAAAYSDADILNFALNLEYLEAEFYTVATTGKTLEQSGYKLDGKGVYGPTTGGNIVDFTKDSAGAEVTGGLRRFVYQLGQDERTHVMLLRSALGSSAVAKPAINLDALKTGFDSFRTFLVLARAFEDVGVSAYGGAAPLITSKDYLATAARIALTEALHSGVIRSTITANNVKTMQLDALDVPPPPGGFNFFTVDSNALAVVRDPSRVLAIAYGTHHSGATGGGFFPNGVNGAINTV